MFFNVFQEFFFYFFVVDDVDILCIDFFAVNKRSKVVILIGFYKMIRGSFEPVLNCRD
jgi:hypothetical protein